jgi:hypothetical protein
MDRLEKCRGRSWKISGSGAAWYSGLAIWLRVAALKMDAQQWAGIATDGTIRGDAVPEIGPQRPSEIAWRVGRGALDMARRVVGTGAKRPFRGKGSLRKGGVLDRRLRVGTIMDMEYRRHTIWLKSRNRVSP